jgi:hypothetical protein
MSNLMTQIDAVNLQCQICQSASLVRLPGTDHQWAKLYNLIAELYTVADEIQRETKRSATCQT